MLTTIIKFSNSQKYKMKQYIAKTNNNSKMSRSKERHQSRKKTCWKKKGLRQIGRWMRKDKGWLKWPKYNIQVLNCQRISKNSGHKTT